MHDQTTGITYRITRVGHDLRTGTSALIRYNVTASSPTDAVTILSRQVVSYSDPTPGPDRIAYPTWETRSVRKLTRSGRSKNRPPYGAAMFVSHEIITNSDAL